MRVNILAKDEDVAEVRKTVTDNLENLAKLPILIIPVSETGEAPATHWFCNFKVSEDFYQKLLSLKNLSEIELGSQKEFLKERNLKIIK